MQKLQRSRQTFIQNTLELKSESSKDKALHAFGNFEKYSKIYYQKSIDDLVDEITDDEIAFDILQEWLNWGYRIYIIRKLKKYLKYCKQKTDEL